MSNLYRAQPEPVPDYSLEQVRSVGILVGMTAEEAETYFLHYSAQDWKRANSQYIRSLVSHMRWYKVEVLPNKAKAKRRPIRLLPIKGKSCNQYRDKTRSEKCWMPAVWVIPCSGYDCYYCLEHLPDKDRKRLQKQGYDV